MSERELKVRLTGEYQEMFRQIGEAQERDKSNWPTEKEMEQRLTVERVRSKVLEALETFIQKKKEYGNTDEIVVSAMKALYPAGVPLERYYEAIFTLKILEKLSRLSSTSLSEERLRDAYKDVVGYGLLGVDAYNREIDKKEKPGT